MNKLRIWPMVGILLICMALIPQSVYADDGAMIGFQWAAFTQRWPDDVAGRIDKEPDTLPCYSFRGEYSQTVMVPLVGGDWLSERWPDQVAGRAPTKFDAPPQLDAHQSYRWKRAMPAARPRLAQLYGVSPEIAKLYWAKYTVIERVWQFPWWGDAN